MTRRLFIHGIDQIESDIDTLSEKFSVLNINCDGNSQFIDNLKTDVALITQRLSELRDSSQNDNIKSLNTVKRDLTTLENEFDAFKHRVNISKLFSRIDNLERRPNSVKLAERVDACDSKLYTFNMDLKRFNDEIEALKAKI
jgi:predicted  nucleic acid-binding Zn-ribbon protein